MKKKNLVLGAIRSYQYRQLEPFVVSLAKTSFSGDLYFLTNDISAETKNHFNHNKVKWLDINYRGNGALNSWSRFWPLLKPLVRHAPSVLSRAILKMILPLQTVRFLHYKDFLKENRDKYENVLLTDVRDVFFQDDPFNGISGNKVQCYEEFGILGEELQYNVQWIKNLYGNEAVTAFADKKILCSGTIIGPVDKMIEFLDKFEEILKKAINLLEGGSDQGIYNYLVRTRLYNEVDIKKYREGQIITVTPLDRESYSFKDHFLVNDNNKVYPVVHQYDRLENIMDNVRFLLRQEPHASDFKDN